MELRSNSQPDEARRLDLTGSVRRMEQMIERLGAARLAQEGEMRAALERVDRVRASHEAQVEELLESSESRASRRQDQLELSQAGRLAADDEGESERAALVRELESAYGRGDLNTRARIERAAQRLLGE